MAINVGNIIVGVGALKIDKKDVGGTRDGVEMAREATYLDVSADQHKATLKKFLTDEKRYIRTSLLEATLENLQLMWGGDLTSGVLSMGIDNDPEEYEAEFVGPAPDGGIRTYEHTRVVQVGNAEHGYQKDGETVIPAEFEILPDLSVPGAEWGTITEV